MLFGNIFAFGGNNGNLRVLTLDSFWRRKHS
jgi:hypothetical protein